MEFHALSERLRGRATATLACATLLLPLAAPAQTVPLPLAAAAPPQLTTKKKLVLLVGAAALYYLYRKHQTDKGRGVSGPQPGQPVYYLSRNGQVYYRDATARVHWVTPPPQGISVPADEAAPYRGLQGYDRSTTGETNLARFATRRG